MHFAELYEYANAQPEPIIRVSALADLIVARHEHVGEVNFFPVDLDPDKSLGHMLYERDRTSPYEGEFTVANIRYFKDLNRCWRRFVCCKELMHVFDTADERTDTRAKFITLMKELETTPLKSDISPMLSSEYDSEWMALIALCPPNLRTPVRETWLRKEVTDYDVALKFRVPEVLIGSLMNDYYDTAVERLTAR